jgi:hypothetical protein
MTSYFVGSEGLNLSSLGSHFGNKGTVKHKDLYLIFTIISRLHMCDIITSKDGLGSN